MNSETKITEVIPDDIPAWAQDAMDAGEFFRVAISRVEDKATMAIGWAYADCCVTLDEGGDPRQTEMTSVLERAKKDLDF
jgi:hypothetical protein